jgi:argininosuccinate synthase
VCSVVGRRSPHSLYQHALATYARGDAFNHQSAVGFIELWGLPVKTQAQVQLLTGHSEGGALPGIAAHAAPRAISPAAAAEETLTAPVG